MIIYYLYEVVKIVSRTGNGRGPLYRGQRYWHGIWNIGATFFIPYGAKFKHRQRPLSCV